MLDHKLKDLLEDLGLSSNDASVYIALIHLKKSGAGDLIKKTNLHRNVVYTSLDHLVHSKMVHVVEESAKRIYVASNPEGLTADFSRKLEQAQQATKSIKEILSETIQEISTHRGNTEYEHLLTSLILSLPKGATKYIIGTGGSDFMEQTMIPIWKKYHKAAKKQDLKIKAIAYASQKDDLEAILQKEGIYNVQYLSDAPGNPSGIHIYPELDTVLNIIYSTETKPVVAIKIVDSDLVQGYLNLFQGLWKN